MPDENPTTFPCVHPHAEIFPMISMEEMEAMAEDIKANGLKHRITVVHLVDLKSGEDVQWILDGRNRWVACTMAGVLPRFQDETESFTKSRKESATLDFVITQNLIRRQLTITEKALVAERIAVARRGGKQEGALTIAEAAKMLRVSASNIWRVRKMKEQAPVVYADLQRGGKYKNINAAYQAAGLNGKSPVQIYVREYEPMGHLKIVRGSTARPRKSENPYIWTPFPTMEEAEKFVQVRRAELRAAAEAEERKKNAETRAREQFSEEQYEALVDLNTLDQEQLIELSYRVDFPKKALLPASPITLHSLESVRKAAARPYDLSSSHMLSICGDQIKILLEHPCLVHPLDDRLIYWLKLTGVKFCDILHRRQQAWLQSILDPTRSRSE